MFFFWLCHFSINWLITDGSSVSPLDIMIWHHMNIKNSKLFWRTLTYRCLIILYYYILYYYTILLFISINSSYDLWNSKCFEAVSFRMASDNFWKVGLLYSTFMMLLPIFFEANMRSSKTTELLLYNIVLHSRQVI